MVVVTLAEVQQWLEATKLTLDVVDEELAESARAIAFGKLSAAYDTSTWVSIGTTPKLVRTVISMLVAAWIYQREYAEEEDSAYGRRRERQAMELLSSIAKREIELEEYPTNSAEGTPSFYPTDEDEIKFTMSGRY